jgi:hypothetical protein
MDGWREGGREGGREGETSPPPADIVAGTPAAKRFAARGALMLYLVINVGMAV